MRISRRLNYTGRRKIKLSEVQIELFNVSSSSRKESGAFKKGFNAALNLDKQDYPDDARVYIEAYRSNTSQRFNFGTVSSISKPESTILDEIDLSGPILFRVKIVDENEGIGKLLASAEKIQPYDPDELSDNASLMTFRSSPDMGQQIWKLAFEVDKPVLCINNNIPEAKHQLLQNPLLQSLILPSAFREVLLYILWEREHKGPPDDDSEENLWATLWIDFANSIAPEEFPGYENDPEHLLAWINGVVSEFSEKHSFCDNFLERLEQQRQ